MWHLIFQFSFFRSFLAWYAVVMSEGDTGCITVPQLNTPVFDIFTYDFNHSFRPAPRIGATGFDRGYRPSPRVGSSHFGLKLRVKGGYHHLPKFSQVD